MGEIAGSEKRRQLIAIAQRVRRGPQTRAGRAVLLVLTGLVFVLLSWVGFQRLPDDRVPIRALPLIALTVVGGPAMVLVSAYEYRTLGRLAGVRLEGREAVMVTLTASVANLLPLPGAVLVRGVHLRRRGAATLQIAAGMSSVGLMFVGLTAAATAVALVSSGRMSLGWPFAIAGVAAIGACVGLQLRLARAEALTRIRQLVVTESLVLVVVVGRLWVVLEAMRVDDAALGAVVLGAASVLSTAVAIFPGGLGLREAVSGAVAVVVGLDAASGVVASSIDRVTFLAGLAVLTMVVGLAGWGAPQRLLREEAMADPADPLGPEVSPAP